METTSKDLAYRMLVQLSHKAQTSINIKNLEDMRVETPLMGISVKKRNGISMVWVGKEYTSDGWLEQDEYDRIEKLKNQK